MVIYGRIKIYLNKDRSISAMEVLDSDEHYDVTISRSGNLILNGFRIMEMTKQAHENALENGR